MRGSHGYDYVAVGHVSCDLVEDPARGTVRRPGGTAFYSALQAARLGLRTLIVTQGVASEIEELLARYRGELDLRTIEAQQTTTLRTRGLGASRSQRLLAWAGPIVTPVEVDAAILHIAPIARETPVGWGGRAGFVGITPQGLIREWERQPPLRQPDAGSLVDELPLIPPAEDALAGGVSAVELDPELLPERFDAAAISEQECSSCSVLFSAARRLQRCVAVTAGPRPTTVHLPPSMGDRVVQASVPFAGDVLDDLGAGDVFAAAFFVALAGGRDPLEAAAFGNAAAALRIAGSGPEAIETRAKIEALASRST